MKYFLSVLLMSALLLNSCSKKDISGLPATGDSFTDSVFHFLNTQLSPDEVGQLLTRDYVLMPYKNNNRFLLLYYTNKDAALLIEKLQQGFKGHIIQISYSDPAKKDGTLLTEDMLTKTGRRISFTQGQVTSIEPTINGQVNRFANVSSPSQIAAIDPDPVTVPMTAKPHYSELPPVSIYPTRDGSANYYSVYYLTNRNDSYYYSYTAAPVKKESNYGGGGGSTTSTPTKKPVVDVPLVEAADKPIIIAKELQCFTVTPGAVYTLRININQPNPNHRDPINTTAERPVGHTYLTLEQQNPDGTLVARNVGWYPRDFVKPTDGLKAGTYQNDTPTPYSVSLTVRVSPTEFMNAKNYLTSVKLYGLQEANCTTIGINTFAKANVQLPRTIGVIRSPSNNYSSVPTHQPPLFTGVNPGDLGEDIRALNATAFSKQNGNRLVIIEKNNSNNKTRSRKGQCYAN